MIIYDEIQVPKAGLFYEIPSEFVSNLIFGLNGFSTYSARTGLQTTSSFMTENGIYGIRFHYRSAKRHTSGYNLATIT